MAVKHKKCNKIATMDETDEDDRTQELLALQAIFPDELTHNTSPAVSAQFNLSIALTTPIRIESDTLDEAQEDPYQDLLFHLPPLQVDIQLPAGYPGTDAPIIRLSTWPLWIPQPTLTQLEEAIVPMWESYGRSAVLFSYISHLQELAQDAFGLGGSHSILKVSSFIAQSLISYNNEAERKEFATHTYECSICLDPKMGSACYRIESCGHVFCTKCLIAMFTRSIEEGNVQQVECPSTGCWVEDVKAKHVGGRRRRRKTRFLTPSQLLRLGLRPGLVRRYVKLKLKKAMTVDETTVWCPRPWCNGAARNAKYPLFKDHADLSDFDDVFNDDGTINPFSAQLSLDPVASSKGNNSKLRLAICQDCDFAFCRLCCMSWHGDLAKCMPQEVVKLPRTEQESYRYIQANTTLCPQCKHACQKTAGVLLYLFVEDERWVGVASLCACQVGDEVVRRLTTAIVLQFLPNVKGTTRRIFSCLAV
ncbi:RWD-domain-containing protein [Aaosphaeria arxii CBS 175.79]|uniref:RBR-type E3 ubiquitin transferase n=1 Tax=Aaosphaeria arxii CBS 175.79 TaxID=1450172 RepID=A0A6A5XRF8_9PLEO|nr:RWD-domain-containing protein [Aaosphaeria arxii CBS 175.79]KAF2014884.1 RWD-domain-containing protein [Aaosphaeria arxii CBS 175.79]